MSREYRLQELLKTRRVWRPGDVYASETRHLPTGFTQLDEWLNGGWPVNVLIEVLLEAPGVGELGLLMPALSSLGKQQRQAAMTGQGNWQGNLQGNLEDNGHDKTQDKRIVWVNPPCIPYAPALVRHGLDLNSILIVRPESESASGGHGRESSVDGLWAMEQALRSASCSCVLGWFAGLNDKSLRRLQLAAEAGGLA